MLLTLPGVCKLCSHYCLNWIELVQPRRLAELEAPRDLVLRQLLLDASLGARDLLLLELARANVRVCQYIFTAQTLSIRFIVQTLRVRFISANTQYTGTLWRESLSANQKQLRTLPDVSLELQVVLLLLSQNAAVQVAFESKGLKPVLPPHRFKV
jgi:hypothetical protein